MTTVRISLTALAIAALSIPTLAQGGGFSASMNQGAPGPTIKMGKPSPEIAKKMKEARQKLLKDLKLTPEQKKKWDATEVKYKEQRSALIKKLQSGGGDMMSNFQQLQGIADKEKKEKLAFLTPAQQKVLTATPGAGSGMVIKTIGGPAK
ncbi:MAG: hypothetical protein QM758_25975 [Armatimonas sp.]